MSDKCSTCDCTDTSQCTKKGYSPEIIETDNSYMEAPGMVPTAEHNGNCKCGTSCACTNCTCGH